MSVPRLAGSGPPLTEQMWPSAGEIVTGLCAADDDSDRVVIARSVEYPAEFAILFDRHAGVLRRYCMRRVGAAVADDVVAETFLVAFERRARFAGTGEVRSWLFAIATNLLHRHHRQEVRSYRALAKSGVDPVFEESHARRVAERVDASAFGPELASALAAMSTRDRDVLLLVAWAELSYAEIAEVLDIPLGTVRSRLNRARARLRAVLPPHAATWNPTNTADE